MVDSWDKSFLTRLDFLWEGKISREAYLAEIEVREFRFRRLCNLFNHDFNEKMVSLFGMTLSLLPEEVFLHLVCIENLHFHHVQRLGEVRWLRFSHPDKPGVFVIFDIRDLSDSMITAVISHEVGHLFLGHRDRVSSLGLNLDLEEECNEQVKAWGFSYELELLHQFLKNSKKGE